jgi:acyl carrier protein
MFTFNSINIYPQDVEAQIKLYPGITDTAVLPKISSMHGNIPVALVVFSKDTKPDLPALKKFLKKLLGIRCPRQITLVDEIPRNTSGKISRQKALDLCKQGDDIRSSIIQILGEHASEHLKPSVISSFIQGDTDIKLRKFRLDSLARMDLLVALEVQFNTIIAPQEFASFRYLGSIVARVLSTPEDDDSIEAPITTISHATNYPKSESHIVNLFRRLFRFCQTVAQLNKALATLENRITPNEFEKLYENYQAKHLIHTSSPEKFHLALTHWLEKIKKSMSYCRKATPEPYIRFKIAPTVSYFVTHQSQKNKTLLVCFTAAGSHNMGMPMAVLLQHIDANQYDLLLITEPLNEKYLHGVPHIGTNVNNVVEWISNLELIKNYQSIRTIGYSAGCYPALIAGYKLKAESAISIGGRFHTKSHPLKSLNRLFTTWKTVRTKTCANVLMIYAENQPRDRLYAKMIVFFTGGKLLQVNFEDGTINHLFLGQLDDRGELAKFLSQTILAEIRDFNNMNYLASESISFPKNNTIT